MLAPNVQPGKFVNSEDKENRTLQPVPGCDQCGNYIDDTFMNVNCRGCTLNPFYMNCFIQKGTENGINEK